jgi:hypothetical protein
MPSRVAIRTYTCGPPGVLSPRRARQVGAGGPSGLAAIPDPAERLGLALRAPWARLEARCSLGPGGSVIIASIRCHSSIEDEEASVREWRDQALQGSVRAELDRDAVAASVPMVVSIEKFD